MCFCCTSAREALEVEAGGGRFVGLHLLRTSINSSAHFDGSKLNKDRWDKVADFFLIMEA